LEVQPSDDTSIAPPEPDLLPVRIDESVFAGFANHQYAQIQTRILDCFAPACDAGIASSAFPNLRNNIGVDQIVHRSTSLSKSGSRLRLMPSNGAAASRAFSPSVCLLPKRSRNKARAACSCSGLENARTTLRTSSASSFRTLT